MDLAGAWKIDRVMQAALERGAAVQLCLDNAHDFEHNRAKNPFFAPGGPCYGNGNAKQPEDFFRLPAAREAYRHRLRYFVARYGAYPNLMAWELWNEIDLALDLKGNGNGNGTNDAAAKQALLEEWNAQATAALRRLDPFDHLITISLSSDKVWPALCKVADYTCVHGYIPRPAYIRDDRALSASAFVGKLLDMGVAGAADGLGYPLQPVLISEFGFAAHDNPSTSAMNDRDPTGVHLHNAIWAGSLSGGAGTPRIWWWDNYVLPRDLMFHYEAFARFIAGEDLAEGAYRALRAPASDGAASGARVVGLIGRRGALLWLQNPVNTWEHRVIKQSRVPVLDSVRLRLSGFEHGRYTIEWWDTYQGKITTSITMNASHGALVLDVPSFRTDVAVKIKQKRPGH